MKSIDRSNPKRVRAGALGLTRTVRPAKSGQSCGKALGKRWINPGERGPSPPNSPTASSIRTVRTHNRPLAVIQNNTRRTHHDS
jgi:hypothetical protein